jgi:gliding motility-associated-like protein
MVNNMRLQIKLFSQLIMLLLISSNTYAQPNWSVHPPDYQYTMTMTGLGVYYCQETQDDADMVAAFIDGECRGVQHFNTVVGSQSFAYMTIYANVSSGSEIIFKLYDASEDVIMEDVYQESFLENESLGNAANPYVFQTDFPILDLYLENEILYDDSKKGAILSQAISVLEDGSLNAFDIQFVDDSLGVDNSYFSVTDDYLQLEQDVDFKNKQTYQVHIIATTPSGCSIDKAFTITVTNTGFPPDYELEVSNLLTPNGDGYNDFFEIPYLHLFENYTLQIFNAVGNELYTVTRDYDNSWEGVSSTGAELPTGTYYFVLKDNENGDNYHVGDIHLFRNNKF